MRASALLVCLAAASALPRLPRDRCAAAKTIEVELGSPDGAAAPPPMTVDQEGPTPWLQVAICAGLYTAPSMLVVAPALVDAKIESETGWPASALTVAPMRATMVRNSRSAAPVSQAFDGATAAAYETIFESLAPCWDCLLYTSPSPRDRG